MTGEEMLSLLDDASDGDARVSARGWLGWSIGHENGDTVLIISFMGDDDQDVVRRWRLEPLDG